MSTLGNYIKTLRDNLELSQASFGEYMGVSSRTIARWEADESIPGSKEQVLRLAKAFEENGMNEAITILAKDQPAFGTPSSLVAAVGMTAAGAALLGPVGTLFGATALMAGRAMKQKPVQNSAPRPGKELEIRAHYVLTYVADVSRQNIADVLGTLRMVEVALQNQGLSFEELMNVLREDSET